MNTRLLILEMGVVGAGLLLLLLDLWTPAAQKRQLGYAAAAMLGLLLIASFAGDFRGPDYAFSGMYVMDGLALFFKRFFLVAAIFVLIISVEFADRMPAGIVEYYCLILFALAGMMFAASANDFSMLFVSVELITVTFYVLTSFQRGLARSLEAGIKYLILGALASAFLVFGIALVFGITGKLNFLELATVSPQFAQNKIFLLGVWLIVAGLGFKIAAVPFQLWAPDVYEGAPAPTTAFLAIGSKAAGFVLLLRLLFQAVPEILVNWAPLLIWIAALTILYGNLCAIPQRNLKRLFGYSSIANAGYLLLGIAALNRSGRMALLYYLGAYLFTVGTAFAVICLALRQDETAETEDIEGLAGLHQRSPLLAVSLTLAMISLAGVPPLAGFFGKFLLLQAVVEQAQSRPEYYALIGVTLVGVVISFYYYFGVIRAIYWSKAPADLRPIPVSLPARACLYVGIAGMLFLGLFPNALLRAAATAVAVFST